MTFAIGWGASSAFCPKRPESAGNLPRRMRMPSRSSSLSLSSDTLGSLELTDYAERYVVDRFAARCRAGAEVRLTGDSSIRHAHLDRSHGAPPRVASPWPRPMSRRRSTSGRTCRSPPRRIESRGPRIRAQHRNRIVRNAGRLPRTHGRSRSRRLSRTSSPDVADVAARRGERADHRTYQPRSWRVRRHRGRRRTPTRSK